LIEGALLYVITQIGEFWHRGPLGRQNTEECKKICNTLVDNFCYLGDMLSVAGMLMQLWSQNPNWMEYIQADGTIAYQ